MFWEKFFSLCSTVKKSPNAVASELGYSSGSVSAWKSGRTPKFATLQRIADYFGVTPDYLLREDDEQPTPSNAQPLAPDGVYLAPLFESVSAGFGAFAEDLVIDHIPIYVTKKAEAEQTICIRVRGDSMAPVICDGDIVQVRKQDSVISGSVAVVMVEDEGFVKSVYYEEGKWIELRSENPDYPPMRFEGTAIRKVRVVGFVTKVIKNVNKHVTEPAADASRRRLDEILEGLNEQELEQFLAVADVLIEKMKAKK